MRKLLLLLFTSLSLAACGKHQWEENPQPSSTPMATVPRMTKIEREAWVKSLPPCTHPSSQPQCRVDKDAPIIPAEKPPKLGQETKKR
jgi:hypothetical protein